MLLWLAQIVRAVPGGVPKGLFVYDIPSTVHVLDLAFVLPLVIGSGVLLRDHEAGPVLAGLVLVKMLTLGLALLFMNVGVAAAGGALNAGETALWAAVCAASGALLVFGSRRMRPVPPRWLRPTLW